MYIFKGGNDLSKVTDFLFGFPRFGGGCSLEAHTGILHRGEERTLILVRGLTSPHGNLAPGCWAPG